MKLKFWSFDLRLAYRWAIASVKATGSPLTQTTLVELADADGVTGIGEAPTARMYGQTPARALAFLSMVDARQLSFDDVTGSMAYLIALAPQETAVHCALNLALLDGAARRAGKPVSDFLGLGFRERQHVTSFSIGIDTPDVIRAKVLAAASYPVLKLKVGDPNEVANLAALRDIAPAKPVRVSANGSWKTKEQAMERIEWLARDGHIQFVEQPMPADTPVRDLVWLKERSPLMLLADESYRNEDDIAFCAECFHGVNLKLVRAGGIGAAIRSLQAARQAGLKTMLGCMIESSVLISAAAHLAELTDYFDLDGNLLITNDPYAGVTAEKGVLSFASAVESNGLRVSKRLLSKSRRAH